MASRVHKSKKMFYLLIICCMLCVTLQRPLCNLYYLNDVHKQMLKNSTPKNSVVQNNLIKHFTQISGQSVGKIKYCLSLKRNKFTTKNT